MQASENMNKMVDFNRPIHPDLRWNRPWCTLTAYIHYVMNYGFGPCGTTRRMCCCPSSPVFPMISCKVRQGR